MLLISRKMTKNIAAIGEADKLEIIEAAKYGANILINSSLQQGAEFWAECGSETPGLERNITALEEPYINIKNAFVLSGAGDAGDEYGFKQYVNTTPGKKYIASLYYRFMGTPILGKNKARLKFGDAIKEIEQAGNEWERAIISVEANHTIMDFCFALIGLQQGAYVEFLGFQVEQSPAITDWGLSKADVQNALEQQQTDVGLLQAATTPENIINTVVLSEEYKSAFAQVAKYEDLQGLVNGDELTEKLAVIEQYTQQAKDDTDAVLSDLASKFEQSGAEIRALFKMAAGINLIRNSTGFFDLQNWDVEGEVQTISNNEIEYKAIGAAFYSDQSFKMTQTVEVQANTPYSFSFWQKKETAGRARITLYNGSVEIATIGYDDNVTSDFKYPFIYNFITAANQSALKIVIESTNGTKVYFSGLMLNEGEIALQWSSHAEEIANTNIRFNLNGIHVQNEVTKTYTVMSPAEFAGYSEVMKDDGTTNIERIFTLNGDTTDVHKLYARNGAQIGPTYFVPIAGSGRIGLALFM